MRVQNKFGEEGDDKMNVLCDVFFSCIYQAKVKLGSNNRVKVAPKISNYSITDSLLFDSKMIASDALYLTSVHKQNSLF